MTTSEISEDFICYKIVQWLKPELWIEMRFWSRTSSNYVRVHSQIHITRVYVIIFMFEKLLDISTIKTDLVWILIEHDFTGMKLKACDLLFLLFRDILGKYLLQKDTMSSLSFIKQYMYVTPCHLKVWKDF